MMPLSVLYVGRTMKREHTNDNNTTAPSFSLSVDTVTVAVALSLVRRVYNI